MQCMTSKPCMALPATPLSQSTMVEGLQGKEEGLGDWSTNFDDNFQKYSAL